MPDVPGPAYRGGHGTIKHGAPPLTTMYVVHGRDEMSRALRRLLQVHKLQAWLRGSGTCGCARMREFQLPCILERRAMADLQRRRLILGSSSAAAVNLSGCGGGGFSTETTGPTVAALTAAVPQTRSKAQAAVNVPDVVSRPAAQAAQTDAALVYGSPLVPADPRRNYIFGPTPAYAISGKANVGVGENVLSSTTTGSWNTALGDLVMWGLTQGINNVGVGSLALYSAVGTIDCTAVGVEALANAVDGVGGTAVGRLACSMMTSAGNNTGIGDSALRYLESGQGNTALGYTAAENVQRGAHNTFIGTAAAQQMPQGQYNTAVGAHALGAAGQGNDNVAVGALALHDTTGSSNVAVGMWAGAATRTATRSIFLGGMAGALDAQAVSVDNVIAIGHGAVATRSHQVVLGNDESQEVVLAGIAFTKGELLSLLRLVRRRL